MDLAAFDVLVLKLGRQVRKEEKRFCWGCLAACARQRHRVLHRPWCIHKLHHSIISSISTSTSFHIVIICHALIDTWICFLELRNEDVPQLLQGKVREIPEKKDHVTVKKTRHPQILLFWANINNIFKILHIFKRFGFQKPWFFLFIHWFPLWMANGASRH